jgi:holo-[acyl-carrier protein] synthase
VIGGIGIDACEIARMRRALAGATGARFRARVFTEAERAYCDGRGRGSVESYAARFAAKEAAMKALGTGWGEDVGFHDVEVVRDGSAPRLVLHGAAARVARERQLVRWHVSLTHTRTTAIAWVVAERE